MPQDSKIGIQLCEVHKYRNELLASNEVKSPSIKEPITSIAKNKAVARKVIEEIKVYTEEDHLKSVDDNVKKMYSELKSAILNLGKRYRGQAKETICNNFSLDMLSRKCMYIHTKTRGSISPSCSLNIDS